MECPICKSVDIRKDFDYPETMMNCKICGSEWVVISHNSISAIVRPFASYLLFSIDKSGNCEEITLNSKTDV